MWRERARTGEREAERERGSETDMCDFAYTHTQTHTWRTNCKRGTDKMSKHMIRIAASLSLSLLSLISRCKCSRCPSAPAASIVSLLPCVSAACARLVAIG